MWVCAICLEEEKKETIVLSCDHVFHKTCVETLKQYSNLCPVCRSVFYLPIIINVEQPQRQQIIIRIEQSNLIIHRRRRANSICMILYSVMFIILIFIF